MHLRKWFVMIMVAVFFTAVGTPTIAQQPPEKIDINKASVEQLMKLKRIGPQFAERIVEYRKTNGPFTKPEDIMKVPGIGSKTLEENKGLIVVEP
jgi:competence protein ComEA